MSCGAYVDVVLVVDSSAITSSITSNITASMRLFVESFVLDSSTGARIGIVEYRGCSSCLVNESATVLSPLSADRAALLADIGSRSPASGSTCVSCGLEVAQTLLLTTNRSGATLMIILIADGNVPEVRTCWFVDCHAGYTFFVTALQIKPCPSGGPSTNVATPLVLQVSRSLEEDPQRQNMSPLR